MSHSKTRTFPLRHIGGDPSLIRYSSKTADQNFVKLSGVVHYMMPYCNSYFKFLSAWFWGVPQQNKYFQITTYGGGDPSLIRYSSKTYARHPLSLSSEEDSLTGHIYCETGHPFLLVISEDPWHSHLPSAWQWYCHYLLFRLRSASAGIWTLNHPLSGPTL